MMKNERLILRVQPKPLSEQSPIPYPYFVDFATSRVLRQDFWHGAPAAFLCLVKKNGDMVFLKDALKTPRLMRGTSPAFRNNNGEMYTMTNEKGFQYTWEKKHDND